MRLLVDMSLSPRWVDFLNGLGHDAYYWSSLGAFDDRDVVIAKHATEHGFIIPTRDLDFGHMLAMENHAEPSVIQIRAEQATPEALGGFVALVLHNCSQDLHNGALITIEQGGIRLRVLPFSGR